MLDFENIEYLLAAKPEATLALIAGTGLLAALVAMPVLNILAPVAKMVFYFGLQGFV